MNLLDEAIKQHLELKRKRGTPPDEVERLEREVFGSAQTEETAGAPAQDAAGAAEDSEGPEAERQEPAGPGAAGEHLPPSEAEEAGLQPPALAGEPSEGPDDEGVEPFDLDDLFGDEAREGPESEAMEAEPTSLPPTEEHPASASVGEEEGHSEEWEVVEGAEGGDPDTGEELAAWEAPSEELEPASEEFEPPSEESEIPRFEADEDEEGEGEDAFAAATGDPETGEEDLLEETPEFLKESPREDELWFEQTPPKDFDFDD